MIRRMIEGLLALTYPRTCVCCGRKLVAGEQAICLECRIDLPVTDCRRNLEFNFLHERLFCHAPIHRAAAYFHYEREAPHSHLIHAAKYGGRPSLARQLGAEMALWLRETGFFEGIDLLVPVPLSLTKLLRRGYNQSTHIAMGISEATGGIPVVNLLTARAHSSQTAKNATERLRNAQGTYRALPNRCASDAHILLVDDVITTGATICACAEAIHALYPRVRISVCAPASSRLS